MPLLFAPCMGVLHSAILMAVCSLGPCSLHAIDTIGLLRLSREASLVSALCWSAAIQ